MIGLQKIDCNCNDCIHMVRDFDKFEQSKKDHDRWQRLTFGNLKAKYLRDAEDYEKRAYKPVNRDRKEELIGKANNLLSMVKNMKYQFLNDSKINFGDCDKLNKPVSFIPNVCQLETQECFKHRRG